MAKNLKPKLIVILGATATGKSELGVKLAKKFGGEIVSADSRQVYKGMDIGTGKVKRDKPKTKGQKPKTKIKNKKDYFHQGIKHHLLDVASPKRHFSVAQYQKLAQEAIDKILKKGKIPFLVGGSPFYLYSVTEGWLFPKLKPDWQLRKKLEKKSAQELFAMLKKLDPERAKTIERKNKRRLIRAIEICKQKGKVPKLKKEPRYNCLFLGIQKSKEELKNLIARRLQKRLKKGMIAEVKKLKKAGLSFKRLEDFGLEYRWVALFLQNKIFKEEMEDNLQKDIEKFAKRQLVWFKKDKRIRWIKNYREAEKLVKEFLACDNYDKEGLQRGYNEDSPR